MSDTGVIVSVMLFILFGPSIIRGVAWNIGYHYTKGCNQADLERMRDLQKLAEEDQDSPHTLGGFENGDRKGT